MHPRLPGSPDFYFKSSRLAVFVDGCFWHGCRRCGHIPKTNTSFWAAKLSRNRERDRDVARDLRARGIVVVRIWEHELTSDLRGSVRRLAEMLGHDLEEHRPRVGRT
jgi:DNA mismatch endonuclease (patch repair protein)